jgi:hypothetical protein
LESESRPLDEGERLRMKLPGRELERLWAIDEIKAR